MGGAVGPGVRGVRGRGEAVLAGRPWHPFPAHGRLGRTRRPARHRPARLGTPPKSMIAGVPAYVDGRMLDIAAESGVRLVNRDRMWHYTEGVQNFNPIWRDHGIRILPGPSSMWFDALGRRLPEPYLPGYDTLGTLRYLRTTPDIAGKDWRAFLRERLLSKGAPGPVEAFKQHGADFVIADTLEQLVEQMNGLTGERLLDELLGIRAQIRARDL